MANEAIKTAIAEMMKANREHPNKERPPNLTTTEDTHQNCSTCVHWEAGTCKLYSYRTEPNQVCESWTPIPEGKQ